MNIEQLQQKTFCMKN